MEHIIHPQALFRLSVLGPLASRSDFKRGEVKRIIQELASNNYQLPDQRTVHLSSKTIERWYYAWRRDGIDGLCPKPRIDRGDCHLSVAVQRAIIDSKKSHPHRSINTIIRLLEQQGVVSQHQLAKATVHRLLTHHQLSKRSRSASESIERRAFEADCCGDLWQGDVMHGPKVQTAHGLRKTYLVSVLDDASRLACHTQFYFNETALSIEHAFKQSLLKRGLPKRLLIDNGSAYRSHSLQGICARLKVQLIYSKAYEPQSKGKIERWHRTLREQFLTEITAPEHLTLEQLNTRLWVYIEKLYHQTSHEGLPDHQSPLARWQQDLMKIQPLGDLALSLDDLFYHRIKRKVKKDGTVSYEGKIFEVPFDCVGKTLYLVVDPHEQSINKLESLEGDDLGQAHLLDKQANNHRKRSRPVTSPSTEQQAATTQDGLVEVALKQFQQQSDITGSLDKEGE